MNHLPTLTNENLIARLEHLAQNERKLQVEVLRLLTELDERRVVVPMGYSGLWDFCRRRLKYSEATATRRVNVARAARRFPELLIMLEDGRLNLGSAAELLPALNEANVRDLLDAAAGKSRREVQNLVIPEGKQAPAHDVIRRVTPANVAVPMPLLAFKESFDDDAPPAQKAIPTPGSASSGQAVTHRMAFTAADEVVTKLEKLQELLGGATLAEVVDRATDLLLAKVDPAKRHERREQRAQKKSAKPIQKTPRLRPTEPRRPPRALSDQVIAEAGQRCTYVSPEGVRCTATKYLTIDHVRPYALGGSSTDANNARCYCSAHNLMAARQSFPNCSRSLRS